MLSKSLTLSQFPLEISRGLPCQSLHKMHLVETPWYLVQALHVARGYEEAPLVSRPISNSVRFRNVRFRSMRIVCSAPGRQISNHVVVRRSGLFGRGESSQDKLDLVGKTYGLGCASCAAASETTEFKRLGFMKDPRSDTSTAFHSFSIKATTASNLKACRIAAHEKKHAHIAAVAIINGDCKPQDLAAPKLEEFEKVLGGCLH